MISKLSLMRKIYIRIRKDQTLADNVFGSKLKKLSADEIVEKMIRLERGFIKALEEDMETSRSQFQDEVDARLRYLIEASRTSITSSENATNIKMLHDYLKSNHESLYEELFEDGSDVDNLQMMNNKTVAFVEAVCKAGHNAAINNDVNYVSLFDMMNTVMLGTLLVNNPETGTPYRDGDYVSTNGVLASCGKIRYNHDMKGMRVPAYYVGHVMVSTVSERY